MDVTDDVNGADVALPRPRVQLPIELGSALHRRLAEWCRQTARALDVSGVARSDVIEVLLEHLVENADTSEAVRRGLIARLERDHSIARSPRRLPRAG
jgi:hypothetical protein